MVVNLFGLIKNLAVVSQIVDKGWIVCGLCVGFIMFRAADESEINRGQHKTGIKGK